MLESESEMKKNFLLENEQKDTVDTLTDEEAGKLFKGIYNYVNTGESGLKGTLKAVFISFKQVIDKNEKKYKEICERNKENVKKRWSKEKNTTVYDRIPNDTDNNHISYITNHISLIKDIINYLNNKTNSKYKYNTKSTQTKINARLNEGYTLDDFIAVIDKKYDEWHGTEFEVYLRPETLFGTKFEGYLNQKSKTVEKKPDWYGKEFQEEQASSEEVAELEKKINKVLRKG